MAENGEGCLEFSCETARLLLRVISVNKKDINMSREEGSALAHYLQCGACVEVGLSEILPHHLSCQNALEVWARKSTHLGLSSQVDTIIEQLAVEHVWGRWKDVNDGRDGKLVYRDRHFGACKEPPCTALRDYWIATPLSMFYDGEHEVAQLMPFIIDIFIKQGWPLKKLFEIQRARISLLLDGLIRGKLPPEVQGHYHKVEDMSQEIYAGVTALQKIILAGFDGKEVKKW